GGLADQLRAAHVVMLGVGLGEAASSSDFDVMSAIVSGTGMNGMNCGGVKEPVPGSFYRVADIDQMLFAFDALNPDPQVNDTKPVCHGQVCQEARHNFVLDPSVRSVNILGSGGGSGIVPYLISPAGQQVELPRKDGKVQLTLDGMPVSYEWQSGSAQTVSLHSDNSPKWPGQWAIVYVDTTGEHPDAVSRVSIHITTDIFPAVKLDQQSAWRSGQVMKAVRFGLVDGVGNPVDPDSLAGSAVLSAVLVVDGGASVNVLTSVPKTAIEDPVDVDLGDVEPGPATLRMSLVITTAPATNPRGVQIAPGTTLSPQRVDVPVQILPELGLPAPGQRIDFGTVEGVKGATSPLRITGPGCVWVAAGDHATTVAAPDGIGTVSLTSTASGPNNCLTVGPGQEADLPVTLHTEHDGHGGLSGELPIHIAPQDKPGEFQTVDIAFIASMVRPVSTTNFVLAFLAALLLGPGIPVALLYAAKWFVGKIPGAPMLAERIPVEVDAGVVLRDGQPFAMADTDLVTPVPGLAGGARHLTVRGVDLSVVTGHSPFGNAHVRVAAPGLFSAGSELPSTDASGLQAVLPLAVHGTWVVLHDPDGAPNRAEVLLMVAGQTDTRQRQKLYEDVERRLPELLTALRDHSGVAQSVPGDGPSPFGGEPVPGGDQSFDPFRG
ncbi:MAG TPA: VWA domain-containing protein, partial [Mycobacterium sp.]|nr:VWA domain-containing protein [Mycobacterium sp.]